MYKEFGQFNPSLSEIGGFLPPASCSSQAKFRLYVDDTTLLLKERFVDLTELFEKGTGAKLNRSQNGEAYGLT